MRVPRHLQLCRAAAGDGNSLFSGWEVSPAWWGGWSHLGLVRQVGGRAGLGENVWELGALRSRWRKQASKLLLISTGDMCPFWWGYLVAAVAGMGSLRPCH